jgi:hypothetical protein
MCTKYVNKYFKNVESINQNETSPIMYKYCQFFPNLFCKTLAGSSIHVKDLSWEINCDGL